VLFRAMSPAGAAVYVLLVISSLHHPVLVAAGAGLLASHWVAWLPGRFEGTAWTLPHRGLVPRSMTRQASCPRPAGSRGGRCRLSRPGTPDDITAAAGWARVTVTAYGRQGIGHVAEVTCLWYGSWHTRTWLRRLHLAPP